jgi:hypothetical protein
MGMNGKFQMPPRKWWAAEITALSTVAVAWVNAGAWNKTLTIGVIGVVTQAAVHYLVPNGDTSSKSDDAPAPAAAPSH